jgi:hypothetical protein
MPSEPSNDGAEYEYLAFELTACKITDTDRNHVLGKAFNVSFASNSALRKFVESWHGRRFADGEAFDIRKLLGQPCMLTVKHTPGKDRVFADIDGISMPMRGPDGKPLQPPPPTREPFLYQIGAGSLPDLSWLPWSFGEPVVDIIKRSPEWKQATTVTDGTAANGVTAAPPY